MDHHESHEAGPGVVSWWELWPMLAWGLFTVHLYASGRIFYLLQPLYGHVALGAGVILLAAFVYGWILRVRGLRARARGQAAEAACEREGCGHTHGGRSIGRYVRSLAFVVPLLIGLSLPARGPNSLAAIQWSSGDFALATQVAAQREQAHTEFERGYPMMTVIEVARCLGWPGGTKAASMGLVVRPKGMPADQFLLVRFTMRCCAACAQPVAVPVRWAGAASLAENQWVKVFGQTDPKAKVLIADQVEPTREPPSPYL